MSDSWWTPEEKKPPVKELFLYCDSIGRIYVGVYREDSNHQLELFHVNWFGVNASSDQTIMYWTDIPKSVPLVRKLFISQPMTGKTEKEITTEREMLVQAVRKKFSQYEWVVLDSFDKKALNNSKPIEELGKCISLMQEADLVAFSKDWIKSKGCCVENSVVHEYHIPYVIIGDDVPIITGFTEDFT